MNTPELIQEYGRYTRKRIVFILFVILSIFFVGLYAVVKGAAGISLGDIFLVFTGRGDPASEQIILNIRLPRVLAALLAGLALSSSGAVMQSLLRNPLASPFTLGISGAAAFGAAFAIVMLGSAGFALLPWLDEQYIVMFSAFAWSMVSTGFILAIAKYQGATPEVMILAGIAIGSLFGAGVSALQYVATDVELAAIVFWMFGDLGRAAWHDVVVLSVLLFPILIFFMVNSWNYKALQSGDEFAKSLGVNASRMRIGGMLAASLATAIVVSYYGIIAFVGLVVPHIVRRFIGGDDSFLIPASALFGAVFLLLSDTVARTLFSPVILPVGILTSFIGAPLFLFLLLKGMGRGYWS